MLNFDASFSDFFFLQTCKDTEYRQSITIHIINFNQFENDCDFYAILKNTTNGTFLGDPSVTRITIVDDDGKFILEHFLCCMMIKFIFIWNWHLSLQILIFNETVIQAKLNLKLITVFLRPHNSLDSLLIMIIFILYRTGRVSVWGSSCLCWSVFWESQNQCVERAWGGWQSYHGVLHHVSIVTDVCTCTHKIVD